MIGFSCISWLKIQQHVLAPDVLKLGVKVGVSPPVLFLASDDSAPSETHLCTLKLHLGEGGCHCEAQQLWMLHQIQTSTNMEARKKKKKKQADLILGTEKKPRNIPKFSCQEHLSPEETRPESRGTFCFKESKSGMIKSSAKYLIPLSFGRVI